MGSLHCVCLTQLSQGAAELRETSCRQALCKINAIRLKLNIVHASNNTLIYTTYLTPRIYCIQNTDNVLMNLIG